MAKITVHMSVSLDGVIQAPGRPDEDTRGGFEHGGWATRYFDPVMFQNSGGMGNQPALLFGRRTYEDFFKVWPGRTDNPFTEILDNSQKFVTSRTLTEPLPWINSTLLKGDAGESVASLKKESDKDLVILGSGRLVRSLLVHRLIDELTLLIHPLVLGSGQRLFPENGPLTTLDLADSKTSNTGVIIANYRLKNS